MNDSHEFDYQSLKLHIRDWTRYENTSEAQIALLFELIRTQGGAWSLAPSMLGVITTEYRRH
jgi:hypothetical protein